ncbi:hypothetical protein Vadar_027732 [Vaccinium darrowii]|uniref:Uncharacterized protein n=1 Tax=Vaccinium darrowii TaxID=229202 RepID=A0ACB7Y3R9_9ERIC|nr:hypothetical protein Vadar_027732 [Vaccinium darrowii]
MGYFRRASDTFERYLIHFSSSRFSPLLAVNRANPIESRLVWNQFGWNYYAFCSHARQNCNDNANSFDLSQYPPEKIRNFSIIAHVDHGKSTLADRLLELTGTIKRGHGQPQYLDKLQVERERGITVKAQTATMFHDHKFQGADGTDAPSLVGFLLNLIDTPGHVDFNYEVSRSLAACQGALLVVDASQGIEAQTVANFYLAFESNLTIVPVINKIDLPTADPDRVKAQLKSMFDLDPNEAILTSAKTGQGLEHVLPAVIERVPAPPGNRNSPLRMLLLDSYYNDYKGVICHVAVVDGTLRKGAKISSAATGQSYEVLDVGIMHPELTPTGVLLTGQVGYIVSGMRSTKEARVGDTLYQNRSIVEPLPGFKPVKHMVFSGVYPVDGSDFNELNHAIERLTCNDASVSVTRESSTALGMGFRCGFLGLLHMDVFHQRLEQAGNSIRDCLHWGALLVSNLVLYSTREQAQDPDLEAGEALLSSIHHNASETLYNLLQQTRMQAPQSWTMLELAAEIIDAQGDIAYASEVFNDLLTHQVHSFYFEQTVELATYVAALISKVQVQNPAALPSNSKIHSSWEPTVMATIIVPSEFVGPVITLCSERRGEQLEYSFIDSQRAFMKYRLPLREVVIDFHNELKTITSGYASFDYEDSEYQASDLVKLDILVNGKPVDAMATIVHNLKAQRVGRDLVEKLTKFIARQQFPIAIQAAIGLKVIARETIKPYRKDVLVKCEGGGDVTRKRKLLEKQKDGKKRMKRVGSVDIPQEAFHQLFKVS